MTPNEVKAALISQGAEDVCTINLRGRLGNISEFVLGTGRSPRHLRKMAESIIFAVSSLLMDILKVVSLIFLPYYLDEIKERKATEGDGRDRRSKE